MSQPGFCPFPEIITSRLLLRQLSMNDVPEFLELRSNDQVMQYIDREKTKTREEAELLLKTIIERYEKNEGLLWVITLLSDSEKKLIGTIGFWQILQEHYRAELGYLLHPSWWNKGIMKEAIQSATSYGFGPMQLHSIEARINPENAASAAILEKSGFTREAYFKEDYFFQGKFMDTAVYSLLAGKNTLHGVLDNNL